MALTKEELLKINARTEKWTKMIISLKKNIPENLKARIGEVLFSQLLPYVGNMKEVSVEKKIVIKVVETILDKYPFIAENNRAEIYKMICTPEELDKIKEEINNDEELKNFKLNVEIVKEFNKGKKYIDDDDYDDY